ncbi:MAG: NADH dehydrogenase FAD-containing subunit, partial [Proteobacteria bacterium]|nr:NADH dehydrogenase FAD-containing subunit [Pseudomonadota bacterium]
MALYFLIGIPFAAGLAALAMGRGRPGRSLLVAVALAHNGLTLQVCMGTGTPEASRWIGLDGISLLFLGITSFLFLAASLGAAHFLRVEEGLHTDMASGQPVRPGARERIYTSCILFFLASMPLVTISRHLGLLWVAVEATTLASAPLIYHHRSRQSLEAAWKYLLICSVGIALALLGNFFLAVSTTVGTGHQIPLFLDDLIAAAPRLDAGWLKAAFLLLLVGYGTKMGLAPMHTWLPDAHSEAPSVVSALLSGALLNCAFLGIIRVQAILNFAGMGDFGRWHLVFFGLLSMAIAAVFLVTQNDYKRMLAYSSVEHMGILALGAGLGGVGALGTVLHALNHSMAKAGLFLTAGNVLALEKTKDARLVRGLMDKAPLTGWLWLAGILAVVGMPPFGLFVSELMILRAAMEGGRWWVAGGFLACLSAAFIAMVWTAVKMSFGGAS